MTFQAPSIQCNPHFLIEKLLAMGVNPTVISRLYNFLTGRPQQVRIGEALSNVLVTNTGAPQGYVPVSYTHLTLPTKLSV